MDRHALERLGHYVVSRRLALGYRGSVQRATDDAANQLAGLAQVTAAGLGNSGITRYR